MFVNNYLIDLLIHGAILVALDAPFLKYITGVYQPLITNITGSPPNFDMTLTRNFLSAGLAYLAMGLALKELAVDDRSALITGLVIYATYSFTNMVVFQKWNWSTAITETIWGAILYFLARRVVNYLIN